MIRLKKLQACLFAFILLLSSFAGVSSVNAEYEQFAAVSGTNSLNIRTGPGAENTWLGSMPKGTWVQILNTSGTWHYVRNLSNHMEGWSSANFLKKAEGTFQPGTTAYIVTPPPTTKLNLREQPSLEARVIGVYTNGQACSVLSEQNGWCLVQIQGNVGYFKREFLRFDGEPGMGAGEISKIISPNGGRVNIRSGPSYSFSVLHSYLPGTSAVVYIKGLKFWFVNVNGAYGFIDSAFLVGGGGNVVPPPQQNIKGNGIVRRTGKYLNLREKPSLSAKVLGHYYGGTELAILSQGGEWCKVRVKRDGNVGYMMSRYLTVYGVPGEAVRRVVHPKKSYVNLRSVPNWNNSSIILHVPHGTVVSVLSASGDWVKVRYNNVVGYMSKYFLR